ncbi:MAG: response regulator [Bacteroidales bacterium]
MLHLSQLLSAQQREVQFDRISVEEGLFDHSINCISQDRTGFIWIGGSDGLYKYDGYEITNFQYQPNDNRYPYFKEVYKIREDRDGYLWVLSETGIILFDPLKDRSVLVYAYVNEKKSIEDNYTPDLIIDREGSIWATYREGVLKIQAPYDASSLLQMERPLDPSDPELLQAELLALPYSGSGPGRLVTALTELRSGDVLIGCPSELFVFEGETGRVATMAESTGNADLKGVALIRAMVEEMDQSLWIAADRTLYHWKEGRLHAYPTRGEEEPTSLLLDHAGNLYLGTVNEIYRVVETEPGSTPVYEVLQHEIDPEFSGYTKTILDIFEDRSGAIWTAQDYYGITRFNLHNSHFNSYRNQIITNFKSTDINPIFKESAGDVWIGTYGGGLYQIQASTNQVRHFDMHRQKNNIICLLEIRPGMFWIGTDRGLVEFDVRTGRSGSPAPLEEINWDEILVWYMIQVGNQVFLATMHGLYAYDLDAKSLTLFPLLPDHSAPGDFNAVFSLCRGIDGHLLLGTAELGILRMEGGESGPVFQILADKTSLAAKGIRLDRRHTIHDDRNGGVWIADYAGLHKIERSTGEIVTYELFENIPYPVAWSLAEDGRGNFWIGTHFCLCWFDKESGKVSAYGKEHGLPITIHGLNSVFKEKDGRLFFGGIGGFYDFHPDSMLINTHVPPVVLTDILLGNNSMKETIFKGGLPDSIGSRENPLRLKYNQNDLAFTFAALDYNQPMANRYAYRLLGHQETWNYTDASQREAGYLQLKPGTYAFQAKGSNGDGIWNEEGITFYFLITKPWWSTAGALLMYVLLALSAISVLFRWRVNRLKKERKHLEELVDRRTGEIREQNRMIREQKELLEQQNEKIMREEEIKNRFFSNISHEFRTPLSLIISPVDDLLANPAIKEKDRWKLKMVSRNSHRLLHLVNQLLDLSRFDSDMMLMEIREGDPMYLLKNLASSFQVLSESKSITFQMDGFEFGKNHWFDPDKLEKIAANLLSNAFKFTPNGGDVSIQARYLPPEQAESPLLLEFSVTDNGPGIPRGEQERIFDRFFQIEEFLGMEESGTGIGLSLARNLARLMHGDIRVESCPGKGSRFVVVVPLGKEHLKEEEFVLLREPEGEPEKTQDLFWQAAGEEPVGTETSGKEDARLSILVVDDSRDMRAQLADSLQGEYRVLQAMDGISGLKKAVEKHPDLIVTDLMMPNMDGLELCRRLKSEEATSHIPVILLTAKDSLGDKIKGLETGADDYIPKPFHMKELRVRIANLIEQRTLLRERFSREVKLEPADITITPADERFLHQAIGVVEGHLKDEDFQLETFYREMNRSRSTMFRKLAALTGQSPSEFIRTIRLKRAASLLEQGFGSVSEISYEVGFRNVSYFNRSFRKLYGLSPREYLDRKKSDTP